MTVRTLCMIALSALLALASPALAAGLSAKAQGEAMIAQAGAGADFTDQSGVDVIYLRHKASRHVCGFDMDMAENALALAPESEAAKAGDDFTCTSKIASVLVTTRVVRFSHPARLDDILKTTVEATRQVAGDFKPFRGRMMSISGGQPMDVRTAVFMATDSGGLMGPKGAKIFVRVDVYAVNGWTMIRRSLSRPDMADAANLLAAIDPVVTAGKMNEP